MRTLILLGVLAVSVTGFSQERSKSRPYNVHGDIATHDLRAIESLVEKLDKEPILGIGTAKDGTVTVTTGVVRGHLSGGGRFYTFKRKDKRWVFDRLSSWAS